MSNDMSLQERSISRPFRQASWGFHSVKQCLAAQHCPHLLLHVLLIGGVSRLLGLRDSPWGDTRWDVAACDSANLQRKQPETKKASRAAPSGAYQAEPIVLQVGSPLLAW